MKRCFPLWITLLPLLFGVAIWYWVWDGYRRDFAATIQQLLPGATVESGGFPYRLEVTVAPLAIGHDGTALKAKLAADSLAVNRVPWQKNRQVLNLTMPEASIGLATLAGVEARVSAPEAQASLRMADDHIARLSIVWSNPAIQTPLFSGSLAAGQFEAHLRETPTPADAAVPTSPRLPTQAQMVLSGKQVRWNGGDPVSVQIRSELTAARKIRSYAGWAANGTVEIEELSLSDGHGRVVWMTATVVPDGEGGLRIAGTLETFCPATLRALAAGETPGEEKRTRKPVFMDFSGRLPGGISLPPADATKPPPPVRGLEPSCPRLHG